MRSMRFFFHKLTEDGWSLLCSFRCSMRRLQSLALSSSAWMDSAAYGSHRHKHKLNKYSIWAPLLTLALQSRRSLRQSATWCCRMNYTRGDLLDLSQAKTFLYPPGRTFIVSPHEKVPMKVLTMGQ